MRNYNYRKNWNDLLTQEIVKKLTLIHEYKGEQRLFIEAHKDELKELVEIAKVQSTEASINIEGISTADDRLKNLVQAKTTPRNRDESELAGYRDVLNTIHENYDYIPINANYILRLHRDLYKFLGNIDGGIFKTSDNIIREMDAEGNEKIRFRPVAAWETPASIDELCKAYNEAKGEADSLLLTMMFILDFLRSLKVYFFTMPRFLGFVSLLFLFFHSIFFIHLLLLILTFTYTNFTYLYIISK